MDVITQKDAGSKLDISNLKESVLIHISSISVEDIGF